MKYGFIFLHRQIKDHWIWNDPIKLKWWLDILFYVNFENKKVNIGNQIFECNRGQSIMSLQNWAIRWNATKGKARSFLELLQKDNMITLENLTKTTRLTVCNYELYQSAAHADETLTKRKQNADETLTDPTKESNKENKDNKDNNIEEREQIFKTEIDSFTDYDKEMLMKFYNHWSEYNKLKTKMRFEMQTTWDLKKRLAKWSGNNYGNTIPVKSKPEAKKEQWTAPPENEYLDNKL